jgi:hypothetical protein
MKMNRNYPAVAPAEKSTAVIPVPPDFLEKLIVV